MGEVLDWIPMSDGARLSVALFLPEGDGPWPVILEALPYRKDDQTQSYYPEYRRLRDEGGYAVARIDVRGTGSSEGLAVDEYPEQEQRDLAEAIAWLASREWSSGAVGMYGASYSGFNALQVACERPPALKAVIAIYATDDRYHDDVHYWGGTRRAEDLVDYPSYMVAMNALPPVAAVVGDGWRQTWRERVENLEPWLIRWLEEQTDGPYWRHGSLDTDYARIACPVMVIGGWADGYRNATLRVLEQLQVPCHVLMGPWSHRAADASLPGPRIDWVPDMIRWWDRWLKGDENRLDHEPPIRVFVRRSTLPEPDLDEVRGEWRFEPGWPLDRVEEREFALSESVASHQDRLEVRGDVGVWGSIWCAGHLPFGQPLDQRPDEAWSLTYDWGPFEEDVEVLGYPSLRVAVASSALVASLSTKLCDVFPDGTSSLFCRGFLNLTHRDSHERPEPLEPERPYEVELTMDATSWVLERGHRLRLDLAGTDWPNVWPPPAPVVLTIDRAKSSLTLPVAGPSPIAERPTFTPPAAEVADPHASPVELEMREGARGSGGLALEPEWHVEHDLLRRRTVVRIGQGSDTILEDGRVSIERYDGEIGVSTIDPADAYSAGHARFELEGPDQHVSSEVWTRLESDATTWHLTIRLDVAERGEILWRREWDRRFPRNLA